ncbi:AIR synthase-related protein [Natranaerofaba carboxydovora]|uniref:AIR synthase-related protein n=1 Tax=Natranaerofaba carboxydovora TaxID=2742683 RepID=UPI001F12C0DE|nr:AIR synthase-related protein [Natranaerofaba carboxydovora]UMZ73759.1 Phosphoribosylformylglycinamidine synthase subunit PurL [Natranaerofaba carboxydovora]
MKKIEKALMHGLFVHLHHNIDKAIDFGKFKTLNDKVNENWPNALVVGPDADDDAAVVDVSEKGGLIAAKMESHCSPCVPRPYDGSATGAGGAMRDVVAMGARPLFLLDFIGTRPLEDEVIIGPCGFQGKCTCGNCKVTTSQERLDIMLQGIRDMCDNMDVFVAGGGFSTSFSDIVPAVVVSVIGKLVTEKPLTKPAKSTGDKLIIIGKTGNDGNDTLYRAGLVEEMLPAQALFEEERETMEASLAAFKTGKINACSDLGAAGVGAAVCESARFGGLGAKVDLTKVPVKVDNISPEEVLICETQARMLVQVSPNDVDEVLEAIKSQDSNVATAVIGEMTDDEKVVFEYNGEEVATIPNNPSEETIEKLKE